MAVERSMHVPVVSPLACGAVPSVGAAAGPGASAGQQRVCAFLPVLPAPRPWDCSLPSSPGGPWRRGTFGSAVEPSLLTMTERMIRRRVHTEL